VNRNLTPFSPVRAQISDKVRFRVRYLLSKTSAIVQMVCAILRGIRHWTNPKAPKFVKASGIYWYFSRSILATPGLRSTGVTLEQLRPVFRLDNFINYGRSAIQALISVSSTLLCH
ncbi:hypothetical protein CLAIMM_08617, partial [Cladophialophora immunda]